MSLAAERALPPKAPTGEWLYGRWTDLLVGYGLGYLLSVPLLLAISGATGASGWPSSAVLLLVLLVNGPHFGATIVRVYDSRDDRRKYAIFAVYATLALAILFAASSRSVWIASVLITAFVTWTPWHFSGQNYGLLLMVLRRRGIAIDSLEKRLVYASFVLSALIAILAIHGGFDQFVLAPATLPVANVPKIFVLGTPAALATPLTVAAVVAYLGCLGFTAWRLCRRARLRDLAPAFLLVLSQALWFTVPTILLSMGMRTGTLVFSALWVNAAHSLQYLWVTAYYARCSESREPAKRFLLKSFAAGTAITALPGLIMAPHWLGRVPWDAGLAATLAAVVNLHHFILDGAIWKLRDGRVARVLLRTRDPAEAAAAPPPASHPWARKLVWTVAALSLFVPLADIYGMASLAAAKQPAEIERSTRLLKWVGRETTSMYYQLGAFYSRQQNHEQAISHYRRSIELFPTGRSWLALGSEYRRLGEWDQALVAFEAAAKLNPNVAGAHLGRAQALLALPSGASPRSQEEAEASLKRALELLPGHSVAAVTLANLYSEDGRTELAVRTLEQALAADEPSNPAALRRALATLQP
jgi:tetratricopeptide (TPR) repeat protein